MPTPHLPAAPAPADHDTWAELRRQWLIPAEVTYLNHGSFGPSPRSVLDARCQWIGRLESQPMDFFLRQMLPALDETRRRLGRFVGAGDDDLVLVENATAAMNVVAASVALAPGDEVLANDHEYGAVLRIWQRKCEQVGARLVIQELPCPIQSPQQVADALLAGVTPRTRLLVFSHVTSPTAVIMPAELICRRARALGLSVCIDGPHAVAMLPLDLAALDCDYYTASCHKWLCGPFGSGFLYAHPRARSGIAAPLLSWNTAPGEAPSWRSDFSWLGTRDPSALLAVPMAIDFLQRVGLDAFRARTHFLARFAREELQRRLGLEPLVPDDPQWYGSMVTLSLPAGDGPALQQALWQRWRIEIPVVTWRQRRWIRPSCHLYNAPADYLRLAEALEQLLAEPPTAGQWSARWPA